MSWILLTIFYEFTLGYLVFHWPIGDIASEFDLLHGRLLPIGLLVLLFAPCWRHASCEQLPTSSASHV